MKRGIRRTSYYQRCVLQLLEQLPSRRISYDDMAAQIGADRRTMIAAVYTLEHQSRLRVVRGRGSIPNEYEVLTSS